MNRRDRELMMEDVSEVLADGETRKIGSTDSPREYTRAEIRALLKALYDKQYDADIRDVAPEPTQDETDQCLGVMLGEDDSILETTPDGKLFLVPNDIQDMQVEKIVRREMGLE